MKKLTIILICLLSMVFLYTETLIEKQKAAKALVERAVKFYAENGQDKAFAEFDKPDGKFVEGELYLFVYDFSGKCLSHGANKTLIGKNLFDLQDPKGKFVVREIINIAKKPGEGWIDFIWAHPQTKKDAPKKAFVKKLGDKEIVIGCGYYY